MERAANIGRFRDLGHSIEKVARVEERVGLLAEVLQHAADPAGGELADFAKAVTKDLVRETLDISGTEAPVVGRVLGVLVL